MESDSLRGSEIASSKFVIVERPGVYEGSSAKETLNSAERRERRVEDGYETWAN